MRVTYDRESDTMTITLREDRIRESDEIRPGVIADFGYDGGIVRFEILDASKVVQNTRIMRRSNCAGALQYVPELTWILFLRILDEQEAKDVERAEAVGAELMQSLEAPYRWQDWAA